METEILFHELLGTEEEAPLVAAAEPPSPTLVEAEYNPAESAPAQENESK